MSAREAMQMAPDALNLPSMKTMQMLQQRDEAITALRTALAEEALQRLTDVHQEIEAVLEQPEQEPYDQTALELCEVCCWKTLIPGDGCLNCERKAQPEQEPVALIRDGVLCWHIPHEHYSRPAWTAHGTHMLYVQPPQRKPLTVDEIRNAIRLYKADENLMGVNHVHVARAVEAAHGIKEQP